MVKWHVGYLPSLILFCCKWEWKTRKNNPFSSSLGCPPLYSSPTCSISLLTLGSKTRHIVLNFGFCMWWLALQSVPLQHVAGHFILSYSVLAFYFRNGPLFMDLYLQNRHLWTFQTVTFENAITSTFLFMCLWAQRAHYWECTFWIQGCVPWEFTTIATFFSKELVVIWEVY